MLTYGCDTCKWNEDFDDGVARGKTILGANEELSKSKPPQTRTEDAEVHGARELTETPGPSIVPTSELSATSTDNAGTPHGSKGEDRTATELPAEAEPSAALTADDVSVFSTGWNKLREDTFQAYLDGYNDCFSYRHTPLRYNPPLGYEKAYKAGWEARMQEEDEEYIRGWTG